MIRKHSYRMSTAGSCARVASSYRLGRNLEPSPDWLEDIAKESSKHEEWVINDLREEGHIVATTGICPKCPGERHGIHVEIVNPLFLLEGHMDGIIIDPDSSLHGLEIKGLSRFRYASWVKLGWEGFPMFSAQVTCYWHAMPFLKPPFWLIAKNRDTGEKHTTLQMEPPMDIEDIIGRLTWVEASARKDRMVSCDQEPGSPLTKYCRCLDCPSK